MSPRTVGVLTPHISPGPELEIPEMSSGRIGTVVSRIPVRGGTPEQLREGTLPTAIEEAAAGLPADSVDVLAYASTSTGYAIGVVAERNLLERLRGRWNLPVVSSSLAAVDALHANGIERGSLVHPAWFDVEASEPGADYFRSQGLEAVATRAVSLPPDPAEVRPDDVTDWVATHLDDRAEAVVLGGNGFLAAQAIEPIEHATGVLVLEANQVLLWAILRETHTALDVIGYGRLLRERAPGSVPNTA